MPRRSSTRVRQDRLPVDPGGTRVEHGVGRIRHIRGRESRIPGRGETAPCPVVVSRDKNLLTRRRAQCSVRSVAPKARISSTAMSHISVDSAPWFSLRTVRRETVVHPRPVPDSQPARRGRSRPETRSRPTPLPFGNDRGQSPRAPSRPRAGAPSPRSIAGRTCCALHRVPTIHCRPAIDGRRTPSGTRASRVLGDPCAPSRRTADVCPRR